MAALSRVSQLKLSLILSRMRREMMMIGCSASTTSSHRDHTATTSQSEESLTKLMALKTHISRLDETRRSAASLRLFGEADDAVAIATAEENDAPSAGRSLRTETDGASAWTHERNELQNASSTKAEKYDRLNSPDFMGALESVFHDTEIDSRVVTRKSWTTDDIIHRSRDELVRFVLRCLWHFINGLYGTPCL